jgi:mannose-1-phosphate guanylyltransferase
MFQLTCLRAKTIGFNTLLVICSEKHIHLAKKQLLDLQISNFKIIGEPFGRNTTAPIIISSYFTLEDSYLLVMSSDHIWDDNLLADVIKNKLNLANNSIVTFGINPTYAETGYGYINYSENNLIKFVEKPDIESAKKYLLDGNYLWNSGNFLFHNSILKKVLLKNINDIYNSVILTIENSELKNDELKLNKNFFSKVENISFDYSVMEKQNNSKVIKYNGKWTDIGSFKSLYDEMPKNKDRNVLNGDIKCIDTKNCFIKSENKLITTLGIENLIIINTRDVLLISDKERSQDIKLFVNELNKEQRDEVKFHKKIFRPWGWYLNIDGDDNDVSKVKRICVYPGKRLSLQSHAKRSEHWVITKGNAKVQVGEDNHILHKNQSIYIPVGVLHRMENIGSDEVEFIETQIGDYLGEDDIIRYEDDFGRI